MGIPFTTDQFLEVFARYNVSGVARAVGAVRIGSYRSRIGNRATSSIISDSHSSL